MPVPDPTPIVPPPVKRRDFLAALLSYLLPGLGQVMQGRIAKWWMPDDVVMIEEIPHTATGKIQKMTLRDMFRDYRLPGT